MGPDSVVAMRLTIAFRLTSVLAVSLCLALVAVPCGAQPVTLSPDEIARLKALLPEDLPGDDIDSDYRQEVVDVVSVFRRHNALSPSALRDLELRYVPMFDAVAASGGRFIGSASLTPEGHLSYGADVRLRLTTEAALTGAWILSHSGVPRSAMTEAERIKAGAAALDHGIAYIVAHELAHKEQGHGLVGAPTMAESRERELSADWRAFEILWQVRASLPLLRELLRVRAALDQSREAASEASSSHPRWSTRVRELDRFLSSHPPDLRRGGLLLARRWSGSGIEDEMIMVRGGAPRWLGAVSPGVAKDSATLMQVGYVEPNADGGVTVWTRQGRQVHLRHIEPIPDESPGWMRIRMYHREGTGWALQHESIGLVSSLVRTPPGSSVGDLVLLYNNDPGADMLSGVPAGPTRQRLRDLQQKLEEERRRTFQSFYRGDFGLLELTHRDRLVAMRIQQLAQQQGVWKEWADLLGNLLSGAHDTPTAQGLGPTGLEMLRQFSANNRGPMQAYKTSDGRVEFHLPGEVKRMDIPLPADSPEGTLLEAYGSIVDGMVYSVVVGTLPYVPSAEELRSRALQGLLSSERAIGQGRQLEELDRREFELGSTYVLEAAVQVDQQPVVLRLRFMGQGRHMVFTVSYLGAANEYDVFDGWRILDR